MLEEVACTSRIRQWGVPGDKDVYKAPVMNTSIKKKPDSKGIQCTLYDPRLHTDNTLFLEKIKTFKLLLANEDKRIGFAHIPPTPISTYTETNLVIFLQAQHYPINYNLLSCILRS